MAKAPTKTNRLGVVAKERVAELRVQMENPELYRPVRVGLEDLEAIVNGGLPKVKPFYIAIVGENKQGKSTFGNQIAWAYAEATGMKICLYNLEETNAQAAERAMAMRSPKVSRTDIFKMTLTEEDLDALALYADDIELQEQYVNDQLYDLEAILADAIAQSYDIVVIDNFQLLLGKGMNERDRLVNLSKILMRARNAGLRIFLLSQGNPDGKSFGSTQVAMDADGVFLIKSKYEDKKKKIVVPGLRMIEVTQCRWAGIGSCEVLFQAEYSRVRTPQTKEVDLKQDEFIFFTVEEEQMFLDKEKANE